MVDIVKPKGGQCIEVRPSLMNRLKIVSYARYTKGATLDVKMSLGVVGVLEVTLYKKFVRAIKDFIS